MELKGSYLALKQRYTGITVIFSSSAVSASMPEVHGLR